MSDITDSVDAERDAAENLLDAQAILELSEHMLERRKSELAIIMEEHSEELRGLAEEEQAVKDAEVAFEEKKKAEIEASMAFAKANAENAVALLGSTAVAGRVVKDLEAQVKSLEDKLEKTAQEYADAVEAASKIEPDAIEDSELAPDESAFNPPPPHRRLAGDLLYLEVTIQHEPITEQRRRARARTRNEQQQTAEQRTTTAHETHQTPPTRAHTHTRAANTERTATPSTRARTRRRKEELKKCRDEQTLSYEF